LIIKIQNFRAKAVNLLVAALFVCTLNSCAQQMNLTGIWSCDDGGTYYLRQNGHTVWWYGDQSSSEPGGANVAKGTIGGNVLSLSWSNVPTRFISGMSNGILFLNITSPEKLEMIREAGGFSGSVWIRKPPEYACDLSAPGSGFVQSIEINQPNGSINESIYNISLEDSYLERYTILIDNNITKLRM
jgi:hypothetical protein